MYGNNSSYSQKNFNDFSYSKALPLQSSDYRSPSSNIGKYQEASPFKGNNTQLTSPGVYGLLMKKRTQGEVNN